MITIIFQINSIELSYFSYLTDIPKNVLNIEDCRKIPKVKSYNSATAFNTEKCVYVRDSTCSFCEHCLCGNMLGCTTKNNGEWNRNCIRKAHKTRKAKTVNVVTSEESEDEEFIYEYSDQESDISDDEINNINSLEDLSKGRYVIYEYEQKKYQVGSIVEYTVDKIILKIARKYGRRGNQITFVWPATDHFVAIENPTKLLRCLPDPIADRIGSSLIFKLEAFGKMLPNHIC